MRQVFFMSCFSSQVTQKAAAPLHATAAGGDFPGVSALTHSIGAAIISPLPDPARLRRIIEPCRTSSRFTGPKAGNYSPGKAGSHADID
jgi:hypothetical protein